MKVAIDFGGTNIKIGFFEKGTMLCFDSIPAHSEKGIQGALDHVLNAINKMNKWSNSIEMVAIATPGVVDTFHNKLISINSKYADAIDFDFNGWCRDNFSCSLVMDNDANTALKGEVESGCAVGETDVVMMILGTGIGTAAMMNGKQIRGKHFQAGILGGHFVVDIHGKDCSCGGRGCLETIAGSRELKKIIPEKDGFFESILAKSEEVSMRTIIQGMEEKDTFCSSVFHELMDIYSMGIINLIYAYDPEIVILSGGVLQGKKHILPCIEDRVHKLSWTTGHKVRFKVPENPNISVLLGLNALMEEHCG